MSEVVASYDAVRHDARLVPARPVSARPVGARLVSARPVSARLVSARLVSTWPVSARPVSARLVSTWPVSARPVSTRPVSARPVSARRANASSRGSRSRRRGSRPAARRYASPACSGVQARSGGEAERVPISAEVPAVAWDQDVAGEDPGGYEPDVAVYTALDQAVAEVAAADLDAMDEARLLDHLDRLARPIAKLQAARSRCMAAVEQRRVVSASPRQRSTARREARGEMARKQRLTPSDAKRASEAGRAADAHPRTGQVFRDGDLSEAHVRLIAGVLEQLPPDRAAVVEPRLLELASTRDAVAFGRAARRVLADEDIERAADLEKRRHGRRQLRITDTDDGGLVFRGEMHGLAAETARAALRAFRRPDTADEQRRPEQREADAFEQMCAAALRSNDAPSEHGTRPQVIVIMQADQLGRPIGTARFALSGQPVTTAELAPILTDCAIGRLVVDAKGTPLEASVMVRDVPAGLWRALVVRDGGCTWDGCDAPASWCDVAHGEQPYRRKGRLSPGNATLLCRRHHRRFDNGKYRVEVDGDQVTFHKRTSADARAKSPGVADPPRSATVSGSTQSDRVAPLGSAAPLPGLGLSTAAAPPDVVSGRSRDPSAGSASGLPPDPPPGSASGLPPDPPPGSASGLASGLPPDPPPGSASGSACDQANPLSKSPDVVSPDRPPDSPSPPLPLPPWPS
jgi:hypothetical protein